MALQQPRPRTHLIDRVELHTNNHVQAGEYEEDEPHEGDEVGRCIFRQELDDLAAQWLRANHNGTTVQGQQQHADAAQ